MLSYSERRWIFRGIHHLNDLFGLQIQGTVILEKLGETVGAHKRGPKGRGRNWNKPEKPKNTKSPRKRQEDNLLLKNARETEFQTSCLHNYEVISICGFEPSSLWEFVMVAIGN